MIMKGLFFEGDIRSREASLGLGAALVLLAYSFVGRRSERQ